MNDYAILFIIGILIVISGILLLKRENRLFRDSVSTTAKVVTYYEYRDTDDPRITMYTMAVEYMLPDGTLIQAREQSGSSSKKYPVGTELTINYSQEKNDRFTVFGDNSRKNVMFGMILVGLLMMIFIGYAGLNN